MNKSARRPIPIELQDAVGFNLYRVALLFRRELMVALKEYKLTPEQWQVLTALWSASSDVNQKDLCELTLKDKHAMSRILVRMERDGWVRRRPDPANRRSTLVRSMRKAQDHYKRIRRQLLAHFEPILAALSQEDTEQLLQSLRSFRSVLDSQER